MAKHKPQGKRTAPGSGDDHRSLTPLVRRIAQHGDRGALNELVERRVFRTGTMRLHEYIHSLSRASWVVNKVNNNQDVLDASCDIANGRFTILPSNNPMEGKPNRNGPDCRNYYRALLEKLEALEQDDPGSDGGNRSEREVALFEKFLRRHFRLSLSEALRSNRIDKRYAWHVGEKKIRVLMPASLSGRECGDWLRAHVDNPDPSRPGEQKRVQAIVDEHFPIRRHVPLDPAAMAIPSRPSEVALPSKFEKGCPMYEMAEALAQEKVAKIVHLRPRIRNLGEEGVRSLILMVFCMFFDDSLKLEDLVARFNISKSALSIFAAFQWKTHMPDLWQNLAKEEGVNPAFIKAAEEAGIWQQIAAFRKRSKPKE